MLVYQRVVDNWCLVEVGWWFIWDKTILYIFGIIRIHELGTSISKIKKGTTFWLLNIAEHHVHGGFLHHIFISENHGKKLPEMTPWSWGNHETWWVNVIESKRGKIRHQTWEYQQIPTLLGGDWNHGILWLSHHIGNVITPTDELHHFSEG